jgi:hypothetical protein
MQSRPVPVADARNSDGSLSYEYLLRNGFQYRPQDGPVSPTTSVHAAFVNLIRAAVESIASAGRDLINGIRDLFGSAGRLILQSVTLDIAAEFMNTDPTFVPGSLLRRAWGIDSSIRIGVPGTPIWVAQGIMTSRDELNFTNGAAVDIVSGLDAMLCIDLENDDAFVTTNVLSTSVCRTSGHSRPTRGSRHSSDIAS